MITNYIASLITFNIAVIILLMPIIIVIILCVDSKNNKSNINNKMTNNNVKDTEKSNIQNIVLSAEKRKGNLGEKIVAKELEKINRLQKNNKWYYD